MPVLYAFLCFLGGCPGDVGRGASGLASLGGWRMLPSLLTTQALKGRLLPQSRVLLQGQLHL